MFEHPGISSSFLVIIGKRVSMQNWVLLDTQTLFDVFYHLCSCVMSDAIFVIFRKGHVSNVSHSWNVLHMSLVFQELKRNMFFCNTELMQYLVASHLLS